MYVLTTSANQRHCNAEVGHVKRRLSCPMCWETICDVTQIKLSTKNRQRAVRLKLNIAMQMYTVIFFAKHTRSVFLATFRSQHTFLDVTIVLQFLKCKSYCMSLCRVTHNNLYIWQFEKLSTLCMSILKRVVCTSGLNVFEVTFRFGRIS